MCEASPGPAVRASHFDDLGPGCLLWPLGRQGRSFRGFGFGGLGFRVWGFGGLGFRVWGFRDLGFRVWGFRV